VSSKRSASTLVLIVLSLLFLSSEVFSASQGPSWGSSEYGSFVRSLILPQDVLVQQQLRSIAPVQDASHFAENLLKIYEFVCQLGGPIEGEGDYFGSNWMNAQEILRLGRGDCKNHAILLITLIEALYRNTFSNVPTDLVWIMGGIVQNDKGDSGAHVWVLLNMDRIQSVSQDAFNLIQDTPITTGVIDVPIGARPPWSNLMKWITINLEKLANKLRFLLPLSVIQDNHFYVELDPSWTPRTSEGGRFPLSISEYYYKKYPAVELHDQWNSYEYHKNPKVTPPGAGSLWLSSTIWRYGDVVRWSAQGLTPNGRVSVEIQGSWGSVQFSDVTANSKGEAGFNFVVGTNILGSGRLVVTDKTSNSFLMKEYTLIQEEIQTTTTKRKDGSVQVVEAYWVVDGVRVTQAKVGQTVYARVVVSAVGGATEGEVTIKIRKDWVASPDTDFTYGTTRVSLREGESMVLAISFKPDQKSSLTFRGFFIHVDLTVWRTSWTMPTGYPPRLRVV